VSGVCFLKVLSAMDTHVLFTELLQTVWTVGGANISCVDGIKEIPKLKPSHPRCTVLNLKKVRVREINEDLHMRLQSG
jgi:hypothetical protein